MSLLDKLKKFEKKNGSEPEPPLEVGQPTKRLEDIEKNNNFTDKNTEIEKNEPKTVEKDKKNYEINVPIRVMMSIVTILRMFDMDSNRLTPKGKNKKEIKYEIIGLVNRLSEK